MEEEKTSCSDNGQYPEFCLAAATDEKIFRSFRQNKIYTSVVETLQYEHGLHYLNHIVKNDQRLLKENIEKFKTSDLTGDPVTYDYSIKNKFLFKGKFKIAPTTLRYIKVLCDLKNFFGPLHNMKILEIGGGYGGQCKLISDVFNFDSYTIYDLEPVLALTKKFLNRNNVLNVNYKTINEITDNESYDLCISNYAFSELNRDTQDKYVQLMKNSKQGYFTCNFNSHTFESSQFTKEELIKIHTDSEFYDNFPFLPEIDVACKIELIIWGRSR